MATIWKRMAVYLGMAEDDYDDAYEYDGARDESSQERERTGGRSGSSRMSPAESSNVRRLTSARSFEDPTPAVQAVPGHQVHLTEPTTFNDIEEVGARFRDGVPVIMNLAGASESVAKRMLDFASGLIYGLDGRIERVGDRVFLLTPTGVEVSTEERRRLSERGFFNQA